MISEGVILYIPEPTAVSVVGVAKVLIELAVSCTLTTSNVYIVPQLEFENTMSETSKKVYAASLTGTFYITFKGGA